MLKLALLGGFRGIAANVLWTRAEELKRDQDWDRMKATVDLITKLQPHFLSVWTFQGWNLAYNVSVEWDAPEDKYEWIKKGIKFLQDGVEKNRKSPDLIWDTAWTYYHKLGFADESIILRRLFRDDDDEDFKTYVDPETRHQGRRERQLPARLRLVQPRRRPGRRGGERGSTAGTEAEPSSYVDPSPQRKGRPGDLAFRSMPAHAQTRYAAAPGEDEHRWASRPPSARSPRTSGPGAQRVGQVRRARLRVAQPDRRDGKSDATRSSIDDATNPEQFKTLNENQKYWTDRWADQMNYRYWKDRCQAEMTDEGRPGPPALLRGDHGLQDRRLRARPSSKFREGLTIWDELLKDHPRYRNDDLNKKDTGLVVKRYVRVLQQLGEPSPRRLPVQGPARRPPSRTPRSTRSTPSRCSASRPTPAAGPPGRRRLRPRRTDPIRASPSAIPTGPGFLRDAGAISCARGRPTLASPPASRLAALDRRRLAR